MALFQKKPSIFFHFKDLPSRLIARQKLINTLADLFEKEEKSLQELSYIFCTDKFLLKMNRRYLRHDYYTDVISFDLSESEERITGEVYISWERVKRNARSYGEPFKRELARVIFHGALHLCGYRDKTNPQKREMRAKEEFYLKSYGYVPREKK